MRTADDNGNIVMTERWYRMSSLKKCNGKWSVSPLYLKTMVMGYQAVKQDNNYNKQGSPIKFQVHDALSIEHGLKQSVITDDTNLYNTPSSKTAYQSFNVCSVPGICSPSGGGAIARWFIYLFETVLGLSTSKKDVVGKFYMGYPGRNTMGNYAYSGQHGEAKYGFKYTGYLVFVEGKNSKWVRAYILTNAERNKFGVLECAGDDIYFPNWVYNEGSSTSSYRKKDEVYETDPSSVVMQFDESFQNAQVFKVDDYPDNSASSSTTRANQEI